ncbi:Protein TIC 20-I, chloroplastic [Castilleja foliolosa]|uniref:Protein TIC 20 n=1 Tax=Castilleja foliolosa TaxID=1961234 RepID=A0ABD3E9H3_9LAMI
MILNGSILNFRVSNLLDKKPCSFRSNNSSIVGIPQSARKTVCDRSFCGTFLKTKTFASLGVQSTPTPLSHSKHGGSFLSPTLPKLPKRPHGPLPPRASKDVPQNYRFPPMTEKPKWWWRTLACLPYLMPLHETWMYAETAYHLHPFLEDFEFLTYPFLGALGKLPSWFLMAYFFVAYLGVVRRKEWPHFFRFHVVMGMLLEIALQVVGTVSRWMPLAWYWGKIGMHFWTAVAFAYMFTVLECIRCALAGMYADVPFVCDAAYIQIPYD